MLAEAVHSVADTSNQGLLLLGGRRAARAARAATSEHPFGHGGREPGLSHPPPAVTARGPVRPVITAGMIVVGVTVWPSSGRHGASGGDHGPGGTGAGRGPSMTGC